MTAFRTLTLALAATALVAGCGTRLNPMNWFGSSRSEPVAAAPVVPETPEDTRQLVQQVTKLDLQRAAQGGAVVTAVGLPAMQGYYGAALVRDGEITGGVLTYRFVANAPATPRQASTPQSRELTAGAFIRPRELEGVRQVVVLGANNRMTSGR